MNKIKIKHLFIITMLTAGLFLGIGPVRAQEVNLENNEVPEGLSVTKTNNPNGEVVPGAEILYTITVGNIADDCSGPLIVRDHWSFIGDETATYVHGSATGSPRINESKMKIVWKIDNLRAGEVATFTYKLQADLTNEHLGTFTILNEVCAEYDAVDPQDPCAQVANFVTYPAREVVSGGGSSGSKTKITPKVLSTIAPTPAPQVAAAEVLPTTGADVNYNWIYYFVALGALGFTYYLKVAGWQKLSNR